MDHGTPGRNSGSGLDNGSPGRDSKTGPDNGSPSHDSELGPDNSSPDRDSGLCPDNGSPGRNSKTFVSGTRQDAKKLTLAQVFGSGKSRKTELRDYSDVFVALLMEASKSAGNTLIDSLDYNVMNTDI
ncbi:hypothetical protein ROHU_025040 [Labeo rohita]|uniref:Uncharacterized protein n=1 Tax=Labeo rohita TaxID=84645 RepID=A0A498MGU4_LABRO|nr:hypothetical protein ROHU_025040 [Labeo rohita]